MVLFIGAPAGQDKTGSDWTATMLRWCPDCLRDSIVGHGRRRKQSHDEHHDWIEIQRGICRLCHKTFTFLPWFSPPYGHYSWIARCQAVQRHFVENTSVEMAAPLVMNPERIPAASTVRRWFSALDAAHAQAAEPVLLPVVKAPFPFLRRVVESLRQRLDRGSLGPLLQVLLPLRA